MIVFTAKDDIKLMGDPDPKYGQSYWGHVQEQDHPVMFNLMQQVNIMEGRKLFAEEHEEKRSKKNNNPYTQLRKVKLSDNGDDANEGQTQIKAVDETPKNAIQQIPELRPQTEEKAEETPSYEAGTNARWALRESGQTFRSVLGRVPEDDGDRQMIEEYAEWLISAFQRLKAYVPTEGTGYSKAKAKAATLPRAEVEEPDEPEEDEGDSYDGEDA